MDKLMGRSFNREFVSAIVNPACGLPPGPPAPVPSGDGVKSRVKRLLGSGTLSRLARLALALKGREGDHLCMQSVVPVARVASSLLVNGVLPNVNSLCMEELLGAFLGRGREDAR